MGSADRLALRSQPAASGGMFRAVLPCFAQGGHCTPGSLRPVLRLDCVQGLAMLGAVFILQWFVDGRMCDGLCMDVIMEEGQGIRKRIHKGLIMEKKWKLHRKAGLLSGFLLLLLGSGWAQQSLERGSVEQKHSPALSKIPLVLKGIGFSSDIDTLLMYRLSYRSSHPDRGYRILVFSQSGNYSKNAAVEAMEDFRALYPEEKVYLVFEEPYFKVKVGNFPSRITASLYLKKIKQDYPYAFVINDVLDIDDCLDEDAAD